MTACPTAHTFEWRAGRLVGIRFTLDDGTEARVGASTAVVENECPHGDPDCEGAEDENHWACDRPFRRQG